MSRTDRLLLGTLALVAVLTAVNVLPGVAGWNRSWRAFQSLGLQLEAVRVRPDRQGLEVDLLLWNDSDVPVRVIDITATIQANGHSVAAGRLSLDGLTLLGGERHSQVVAGEVYANTRQTFEEQIGAPSVEWTVSGQMRVAVQSGDVAEEVLIPYRGIVDGH